MSAVMNETVPFDGARWHPYADIFPWIEGDAFRELVEDVRKNGVIEPIVFHEGMILDGRNRYMAARELGIAYPRVEYEGDDPLGYVISLNLKRRHLTESQRAMVATRMAKMQQGRPVEDKPASLPVFDGVVVENETAAPALTQTEAAKMLNVSERSIRAARTVEQGGAPELVAAVDTGKTSVSAAAEVATLPKPEQVEIVARGEKEILARAKAIRAEKAAVKGQSRQAKEAALAENIRAAASSLGEKLYGVILADPPWRFEPYSRSTGMDRAADNHYPTMDLEEIEGLAVPAASDCALFLWATAPMLPQALSVMKAWGFTYKSHVVWAKDRVGTGYWARNKHELLLIGTRGNIPAPEPGTQPESLITAPVGAHSAKPEQFHEIIERIYPTMPRLEMFSRAERDGWDAWGAEAKG